jgi:hypothetical protein
LAVSRQQAAIEQLEQAIDCFFQRRFAAAITLACAAEGMFPIPADQDRDFFACMKSTGALRGLDEGQLVSEHINKVRDWLKHKRDKREDQQTEIGQPDAEIAIVRGYTRFTSSFGDDSATPTMLRFENWFRENSSLISSV